MSKVMIWKCDECEKELREGDRIIHVKEVRQEGWSNDVSRFTDGSFDFCCKDCLVDFFAKYPF